MIAKTGFETTTRGEYEPRWMHTRFQYTGNGMLNLPLWQSVRELSRTSTSHEYAVVAKAQIMAIDSTTYYPGWTVTIDGRKTSITPAPIFGLISFMVPAGQHDIRVELRPTRVRRLAFVFSMLSLFVLLLAATAAYIHQVLEGTLTFTEDRSPSYADPDRGRVPRTQSPDGV